MSKKADLSFISCVAIVAIAFLSPIVVSFAEKTSETEVQVKIVEKTIKPDQSNGYLVFTENEVFEVEDSIAYWRWNSSDVYNKIKVGEVYNCKVCGWRVPFLSLYRNIITADAVPAEEDLNEEN